MFLCLSIYLSSTYQSCIIYICTTSTHMYIIIYLSIITYLFSISLHRSIFLSSLSLCLNISPCPLEMLCRTGSCPQGNIHLLIVHRKHSLLSDKVVATHVIRFLQYTEAISVSLFGPWCSTLISLIQLCNFLCGSLLICPQYDACSDKNAVFQAAEISDQETHA